MNRRILAYTSLVVLCSGITGHAVFAEPSPSSVAANRQQLQLAAQDYLSLRNKLSGSLYEDEVRLVGICDLPDNLQLMNLQSTTKPSVTYDVKIAADQTAPRMGISYRALLMSDASGRYSLLGFSVPTDVDACEQQIIEHDNLAKANKKIAASKPVVRANTKLSSRFGNASYMPVYPAYLKAIKGFNPRLTDEQAEVITHSLLSYSQKFGVDPRLVVAMILAESHFNPDAVSRAGATGLGQLMPRTANGLGVGNPRDPRQNLYGSIKLLRGHLSNYASKVGSEGVASWKHIILTMAAYNAGSGAVKKYGGVPPFKETRAHVEKVIGFYKKLCSAD